jgi:hypothetical protein
MPPSDVTPPEPTAPAPPPEPARADAYEFTPGQGAVFARLATRMQFVGLFALGAGVLAIGVGAWRREVFSILTGMLYAVIGLWTERAGFAFRGVATTEGHDIRHLMKGLRDLERLYTVQFWICVIALIVALVLAGATALY